MKAGASAGRTRWLDLDLSRRLSAYFHVPDGLLPGGLIGALRRWQREHLRRVLLKTVNKSPYYRERIGPRRAHSLLTAMSSSDPLDLLSALPFTLPADLEQDPEAFLTIGHGEVDGVISLPTSGSTGPGKRIFCSAADLARTTAFFRNGMRYLVRPGVSDGGRGDRVALLMSGDRPGSVGDLLSRAMADIGVACSAPGFVPPGADGEASAMDALLALRPTCLVGVPSQVFGLARNERARALGESVSTVLLSGDTVTPALRRGIAEGLGCAVFVHYGLTETGLGGAVECPERAGCHMREADLLVEIVDEAGRAVPDGEWGEVAISTLTREAMPLLRYRSGDEGRIAPEPCACGSVLRRLYARGRLSERVPLPDGGMLRLADIDQVLYALPFVRGYAAILHEGQGGPAGMTLEVDLSAGNEAERASESLRRIREALTALPGARVAESESAAAGPGFTVAARLASGKADAAEVRRRQAKQVLIRQQFSF
ncbi:MAG: AMP-binding protein [Desulfovibrio sp.]|jgi:phenylacetate-coenzyme A ligase PaaK-like adenylate-forming protein|nr:AMP-binding protein [Desulfovibrio sp.]